MQKPQFLDKTITGLYVSKPCQFVNRYFRVLSAVMG